MLNEKGKRPHEKSRERNIFYASRRIEKEPKMSMKIIFMLQQNHETPTRNTIEKMKSFLASFFAFMQCLLMRRQDVIKLCVILKVFPEAKIKFVRRKFFFISNFDSVEELFDEEFCN